MRRRRLPHSHEPFVERLRQLATVPAQRPRLNCCLAKFPEMLQQPKRTRRNRQRLTPVPAIDVGGSELPIRRPLPTSWPPSYCTRSVSSWSLSLVLLARSGRGLEYFRHHLRNSQSVRLDDEVRQRPYLEHINFRPMPHRFSE